ncbi:MAG: S8 family serine peptidase [Acidimicrobiales bacterium]
MWTTAHRGRAAAVALMAAGLVLLATATHFVGLAAASNDPLFARQWNLAQVGAPDAWSRSTGKDVLIGVVDTGVDLSHPDLAGKVVGNANCIGATCRDGGGQDDNGHGTEVSGIAAALTGNGKGVAGVAPDAKLLVAKALDSSGAGRVDDINAGIRWVVDHGAKVVNLSLGDEDFQLTSLVGTPLRPGIEYAWTRGAVPVLASGNYRMGLVEMGSANYGDVDALVVGATTRANTLANYSTSIGNAKWGLAAPGGSGQPGTPDDQIITTALGGGYTAVAGTSAAAPHVAGAVADLLAEGLSATAAVSRVLATLDTSVPCGNGCQGRLDLRAATAPGATPAPAPTVAVARPGTTERGRPATSIAAPTTAGATTTSIPLVSAGHHQSASGATGGGGRNPVVVGLAIVLAVAAAGATGGVWLTRLRADGGW